MASLPSAEGRTLQIRPGLLSKVVKKEGSGELPSAGQQVSVHYTGRLADGTVFDSSRSRNEKFSFRLGAGEVIKGWDLGVATMRVGELCELTVAPEYGYGDGGIGPIPGKATLTFEVELFAAAAPSKLALWRPAMTLAALAIYAFLRWKRRQAADGSEAEL